jgi:hypothetical protein
MPGCGAVATSCEVKEDIAERINLVETPAYASICGVETPDLPSGACQAQQHHSKEAALLLNETVFRRAHLGPALAVRTKYVV